MSTLGRTSRRLTWRIIADQPLHWILVTTICLFATAAGVATHHATRIESQRLASYGAARYGSVSLRRTAATNGGDLAPAYPALSHDARHNPAWFSLTLLEEVRRATAPIGVSYVRRIEGAAHGSDGRIRPFVAIGRDDPARTAPVVAGKPRLGIDYTIVVRRGDHRPVEWHVVPEDEVVAVDAEGVVWIELPWVERVVLGDGSELDAITPVANVLVAAATDESAFAAAFEIRELVAGIAPHIAVRAWPELVGFERYAGVGGAAGLFRPLVLLVAAVSVGGAVVVAMENRARDTVLLRTLGFNVALIRAVYVREIAAASFTAGAISAIALLVASLLRAAVPPTGQLVRTIVGVALLPPAVAFLTVRRQLMAPLARIRREAVE
ncbi:MAG: hypothetical protein ACLFUA_06445 [Spirochaetales bacterium]